MNAEERKAERERRAAIQRLMQERTSIVGHWDAPKKGRRRWGVQLSIDQQHFQVGWSLHTKREAEWLRWQLAVALHRLINAGEW